MEEQAEEVCAFCGKAAVDNLKLKKCGGCELVKYCGVDCQKNHWSKHKKACKKRMAEIRDDQLFTQPDENYLGECPICCLPLHVDVNKWSLNSCCGKVICKGCSHADQQREEEQGLEHRCPYCREPLPKSQEEIDKNYMKRVKVNDQIAIFKTGEKCHRQGDIEGAFQYWTKAARMGHILAHYNLSVLYHEGAGIEKDEKKAVYHLEEAVIGGHPQARYNLGCVEVENGRGDRAKKHKTRR
jgi:hypothetical protein